MYLFISLSFQSNEKLNTTILTLYAKHVRFNIPPPTATKCAHQLEYGLLSGNKLVFSLINST